MEENKQKVITYVGIAIISLLSVGLIFTVISNSKNKQNLNAEKITSEKLLSEKLMTEKSLMKLNADFSVLKEKSDANSKLLAETNQKIAEYEQKINSLSGENKNLRSIKKDLTELQKVKASLEDESSRLKTEYNKLLAQNKDLLNSNSSLEGEKKDLTLQLEKIQLYSTDNFLVTATRGKSEKIMSRASRTKKLSVNIEVSKKLTDEISFKIITPSGATINPDDKAMTWTIPNETRNYTASLSGGMSGEFVESKLVVLSYAPKTKLVAGEYKIQILSKGNIIGNCRIKLR